MTFVKHCKLFSCFFFSKIGPQKVFGKSILKTRLLKLSKYRFFNGQKIGIFPRVVNHNFCHKFQIFHLFLFGKIDLQNKKCLVTFYLKP